MMTIKSAVLRTIESFSQTTFGYSAETVSTGYWNESYNAGAWTRLESSDEAARYGAIVGFCEFHASDSVLDVGCGHGVLYERLARLAPHRYVGTDVSSAAIARAKRQFSGSTAQFRVENAETCPRPTEKFGLIIFNESLYYMQDPKAVIEKFTHALAHGGHIIVSMLDRPRSQAAWKLMPPGVAAVDSVQIINKNANLSWTISVFAVTG
jgi:2-polyprenyl-3-methyl-5-hydroxy-6-metoxy-1,4-benzoquinol methylase